jgi:hypothetical protein
MTCCFGCLLLTVSCFTGARHLDLAAFNIAEFPPAYMLKIQKALKSNTSVLDVALCVGLIPRLKVKLLNLSHTQDSDHPGSLEQLLGY